MLKIEVYCSLILLAIFIVSMLSSCSRSDINSTYALFSYYALLTHRQYNSLKSIIIILVITSLLIIGADIWAISLLPFEQICKANRFIGYIWIIIEIGLKICLIILLLVWRKHNSELEEQQKNKHHLGDNSLIQNH